MEFKFIMGVDMSKNWFNFCLMNKLFDIVWEGRVENAPEAIFSFLSQLSQHPKVDGLVDIILVVEHTGIYVKHLVRCWLSKGGRLSLVPATKVSDQLGGQQGWEEKEDPIDARRLAEYGHRFSDKLKLWQAQGHTLEKLQHFQRQRERFQQVLKMLQVPVKESQSFDVEHISSSLIANQQATIEALKNDLKRLDQKLHELVQDDAYLAHLFDLMTSVEGIGAVTAREILIATGGFTTFKPNQAKAFARHTGVVPLKRQSGKSVKKRTQISKRANKRLKTLLTLGATSLIRQKSELALYYHRKKQEGKHHMSIINAMRNKLILRVFAVVRNQVMYEKNLNICLD